jgi:hypothetical protein
MKEWRRMKKGEKIRMRINQRKRRKSGEERSRE